VSKPSKGSVGELERRLFIFLAELRPFSSPQGFKSRPIYPQSQRVGRMVVPFIADTPKDAHDKDGQFRKSHRKAGIVQAVETYRLPDIER
jgi:hypothetical protein